jgi:hypothetical protein
VKVIDVRLMPWKSDGVVVVGGTPEDFTEYAKRFGVEPQIGSQSVGHAYYEYGKRWLIWVESLQNLPELAHEALHITGGLLEARGLKYSRDSEEAYCYTMEDILRQTLAPQAKWSRVR